MPETNTPTPATEDSGPRSFSVQFQKLGYGDAESVASYELHELIKACQEQALTQVREVSGKLTIEIDLAVDENGEASLAYTIKRKDPKRRTPRTTAYVNKHGHLVGENPKQMALLGVRDASAPRAAVRDAGEQRPAAREV